jgi:hypothetical protein
VQASGMVWLLKRRETEMNQVIWTNQTGTVRVVYSNFWYKVQFRNTKWRDAGSFRDKNTAISVGINNF